MEAWGADGRDGPESRVNYGGEVPATASQMFVLQLVAPHREEDAMISTRGEAARRSGCSAVYAGHLVGEGQIVNAYRAGALRMTGDGRSRQPLVLRSGLAEVSDRHRYPSTRVGHLVS